MKRYSDDLNVPSNVMALVRDVSHAPPQSPAQTFGDYLRYELQMRKWSLRHLAVRSGVDHSTISRLMRGTRSPSLQTVTRIQTALGGSPRGFSRGADAAYWMDPVQRVTEALGADPALHGTKLQQVLRYYRTVRTAQATAGNRDVQPAAIVRRIGSSQSPR